MLIEVGERLEQQIPIQLKEIFVAKLSHKSPHTFHLNKLDPKFYKGCLYEFSKFLEQPKQKDSSDILHFQNIYGMGLIF